MNRPSLQLFRHTVSGSAHSQQRGWGLAAAAATRFVLTVVSWNIFGSSGRGMATTRNILVPQVIRRLNPDLVLLQETRTSQLVKRITDTAWPLRHYKEVWAQQEKKSRILYDANLYTPVSLEVQLEEVVERLQLAREVSQVVRGHTSITGLRQTAATGETSLPVFLSFHNQRSREVASAFCQVVKTLDQELDMLVVAGADMNCPLGTFKTHGTHIPFFPSSKRRSHKPIDFLVFSRSSVEALVRCEGLEDAYHKKSSKLHKLVREEVKRMKTEDKEFTIDTLNLALDHDPLVCELTLTHHNGRGSKPT